MTRVAAVQLAPVLGDLPGNLERAADAVASAARDGARLVVLPELATSGYVFASVEEARDLALPADDPRLAALARAAGEAVVVVGFAEAAADGRLHNSAALLDASGVRAVYRKAHLWDREKLVFAPGDARPPVVETPVGRVGVMVCFDLEFPEWPRLAALAGADVLAVPTNWPRAAAHAEGQASEVVIAAATARLNRMAVVCADRTGAERGVDWTEGTLIVDADGRLQGRVGPGAGTAWADLDLAASRDKRQTALSDLLGDRRPELYGPLAGR
ncbi:nitrilase-related carbon-nitrogen hydrolase [Amnibacterium endophyticum]|uniref:Nitrilase-related carbon-nitrogen hydrolase n=1 Tax=Amnibacterium endophyticum TaxID=2109337 RepID=A0ABW4LFF5_9MICO